jgi:hypothetical protein
MEIADDAPMQWNPPAQAFLDCVSARIAAAAWFSIPGLMAKPGHVHDLAPAMLIGKVEHVRLG